MNCIELYNEYEQVLLDETVKIPVENSFTEHEIDFINCYVRDMYKADTESALTRIEETKKWLIDSKDSDESKIYQLMLNFKHIGRYESEYCLELDIKRKLRFRPELVKKINIDEVDDEYADYDEIDEYNYAIDCVMRREIELNSFDTDEKWADISDKVREEAMRIHMFKIRELADYAEGNEDYLRSKHRDESEKKRLEETNKGK